MQQPSNVTFWVCCKCLSPSRWCPQQQRQIKMQVQKGSWLLLSNDGLKSQNVPCPEQTMVGLLHNHVKQMIGGDWDFCSRKTWMQQPCLLQNKHCCLVQLWNRAGLFSLFNGQSCTLSAKLIIILAWCAGCSCCSSLSQWCTGCVLVTLTHKFILRLPHALMTTLWGFGAYDVVLRKRNQDPEKPTWWAGSLRGNQKNNLEQVRPLSYLALQHSCWTLSVLCTNKSLWLVLLAFWGFSHVRQLPI